MKIQLEPLKLIDRNVRIEFTFGEEKFLADPNEFCTAQGAPHTLFTPIEEAMSKVRNPRILCSVRMKKIDQTFIASS